MKTNTKTQGNLDERREGAFEKKTDLYAKGPYPTSQYLPGIAKKNLVNNEKTYLLIATTPFTLTPN